MLKKGVFIMFVIITDITAFEFIFGNISLMSYISHFDTLLNFESETHAEFCGITI